MSVIILNIMIELKSIYKSFEEKKVLNDVNCIFESGKTNLIIGRSGSGKTVLMNCIVGLMAPDSGVILYDNDNFLSMNKKEVISLRRHMGMLFQSSALFDSMTVLENVMFPLDMFSNESYKERKKRAEFCLDRVNLSDAAQKYPGELSGGMQKRAAIARAISMKPKYLFCDEPNSGLDPKTSLVIDQLIKDITEEYNICTVINSHDMNSIMEIGDNIIFLRNGKKEWQGSRHELFNTNNEALNDFVFASELFKKVKAANHL